MIPWRIFSFGLALTIMLSASLGWAAEEVKVRGGAHEGFGRLVFEWRKTVGYTAKVSGDVLSVRFERPMFARLDFAVAKLRDHVQSARISKDGKVAIIRLNGAYSVSSFRSKTSIIVDFRPGAAPRPAVKKPTVKKKSRPNLRVRVGEHPTYTRLVFDWKTPTRYTVKNKGGDVTVSFAAPASVNEARLTSRLPKSVRLGGVTETRGGITLSFKVSPDARTRHFVSQNRVVVDVLDGPPQKQSSAVKPGATKKLAATKKKDSAEALKPKATAAKSAAPKAPKETIPNQKSPESKAPEQQTAAVKAPAPQTLASKAKDSAPTPTLPPVVQKAGAENSRPEKSGSENHGVQKVGAGAEAPKSLLPAPPSKLAAPQPSNQAAASSVGKIQDAKALGDKIRAAAARATGSLPAVAAKAEQSTAPGPVAPEPAAPDTATAEAPVSTQPDAIVKFRKSTDADQRKRRTGKTAVSLKFEWPEPVGAAVFQRAGYTWIVFDKRKPLDLAQMRQDSRGVVTKIEQLPISNASVIRVSTGPEFHPRVRQDGLDWIVEFVTQKTRPEVPIPVEPNPEAEGGAQLFIPATEIGKVMVLPDPEVGDELQIATLRAPGQGIKGDRTYPEFRLLGSVQGVVMQPLSDDVALRRRPEGLVVSMPGGLYISDLAPDYSGQSNRNLESRRLFKVLSWARTSED
ncbi:MAG: hypothetical protein JKY20_06930, partial [Alphaproteobacteria bacterium]|nr:hypothetical protein [Alphaproteobacteria bacterium]